MSVVKKGEVVGYTFDYYNNVKPAIVYKIRNLVDGNQHLDLVVFDSNGCHIETDIPFGDDTSFEKAWTTKQTLENSAN